MKEEEKSINICENCLKNFNEILEKIKIKHNLVIKKLEENILNNFNKNFSLILNNYNVNKNDDFKSIIGNLNNHFKNYYNSILCFAETLYKNNYKKLNTELNKISKSKYQNNYIFSFNKIIKKINKFNNKYDKKNLSDNYTLKTNENIILEKDNSFITKDEINFNKTFDANGVDNSLLTEKEEPKTTGKMKKLDLNFNIPLKIGWAKKLIKENKISDKTKIEINNLNEKLQKKLDNIT